MVGRGDRIENVLLLQDNLLVRELLLQGGPQYQGADLALSLTACAYQYVVRAKTTWHSCSRSLQFSFFFSRSCRQIWQMYKHTAINGIDR